jgi:ketosteroid isomerase-like protein
MSNASVARQYLQAVESLGPLEDVAAFYSPDVVFQEFSKPDCPQGRIRRAGDLSAAYQKGQQLLRSQTYAVQRIVEAGDEVAVELEWTGVLAIPVMNLPRGAR